eukprot:1854330-Pyramimonas_sp.AAC.1
MSISIGIHGCEPVYIAVRRGVKQGCPISGLIFCLCINPILTRIRNGCSSLPIEMGAFAGGIGICCRDVLQSLPTILKVLSDGGKASGLILYLAKCVL